MNWVRREPDRNRVHCGITSVDLANYWLMGTLLVHHFAPVHVQAPRDIQALARRAVSLMPTAVWCRPPAPAMYLTSR